MKKQFQAESQRLLDLMINSIYSNREIFLRELISNAGDAMDKRYYHALQGGETGLSRDDFAIEIALDVDARMLTLRDNGCGMSAEELEGNLGVIAHSGTLEFREQAKDADDIDVIGQFGVGFYSAFMVAAEITVRSRKAGAEQAWQWHSTGADGYTLEECDKADTGTEITLVLKDGEDFDEYLQDWRVKALVKRYSDYIRYPIKLGDEVLNSMSPIWKRSKNEVTDEEYAAFYRDTFRAAEAPLRSLHVNVEGQFEYRALLFLPARPPHDYYSRDFEKGLKLYANGVMIMEHCKDLLPDAFSFMRGIVDSSDLSLNISREMLQQDKQVALIAKNLEKKIRAELKNLLDEDRAAYNEFYAAFGLNLKYALYGSFGMQRELLLDLLQFATTTQDEPATFAEYIARMPETQQHIYYATGESAAQIKRLPQCERLAEQGAEIICLTDDMDEFLMKMLWQVDEKELKNVNDADLDLESDEEKAQLDQAREADQAMFEALKNSLGERVAVVEPTTRLKSHAVCLTSASEVSLDMERVLQSQPGMEDAPMKAERVLQLNVNHPVYAKLQQLDGEQMADYATLLYNQALLIEGYPVEDAAEFSNAICRLMA